MILRPADFGAAGDGGADDAPALAALFAEAMTYPHGVTVDLSGHWLVASPVIVTLPDRSEVYGGHIEAHEFVPGASPPQRVDLSAVVVLHLGYRCTLSGLRVTGQLQTGRSWLANRNVDDCVRLVDANDCGIYGLEVEGARRWGVSQGHGGNVIGCYLHRLSATYCGSTPAPGAPAHTRAAGSALEITRLGAVANQTAGVSLDFGAPLGVGDYLRIEGRGEVWLCEVLSVDGSDALVWPWPGTLQGEPDEGEVWHVEAFIGGGLRVTQGDTSNLTVDMLTARYCAVGLSVVSLFGAKARSVTVEPGGAAVVVGSRDTAVNRGTVDGLHSEQALYDVVVGGKKPPRFAVSDTARPLVPGERAHHVRPVTNTGEVIPATWPLVGLQP